MTDYTQKSPARSSRERFERFDEANPHVYKKLLALARRAAYRNGERRGRLGFRCLWENLRWFYYVETDEAMPKLNDHYCPYYARKLMEESSDLHGLFELREMRNARLRPKGKP